MTPDVPNQFGDYLFIEDGILLIGRNEQGKSEELILCDRDTGARLGAYRPPECYSWASSSRLLPLSHGYYCCALRNGRENEGWQYWRYFIFKPEELLQQEVKEEIEPLLVSFQAEKDDNGDNRYRVTMPDCDDPVTYIWQMQIGAQSCGAVHAFSGMQEDKPFDPDFAGEIILDCRNMHFDLDNQSLMAKVVESIEEDAERMEVLDPIDHEPIRVRCEF
ncbi:hypothetical protein CF392_15135 [Tamilnaduibacter salinus]|uniref:Uncharacterized protein n=1 Tax=Tamilnaduibacter salinus TaxID=1484056 RepID=A0A2A2HZ54_9GAMM|nr:hypothetical protein CF392_15135 [Tamilnaduibacter salinus]